MSRRICNYDPLILIWMVEIHAQADRYFPILKSIPWLPGTVSILKPYPTVANSCTNQCEWHRLRMETIFALKIWGSYWVYLYAEPERFNTIIICESIRIRHELNTNWYDAVRCNNMQHDGDTMQYEAVRWWWRINTIALWCDENMTGTNRNLHKPMRTCVIQYDNAIIAYHIATYWVAADRRRIPVRMYNEWIRMYNDEIRTNRNWHKLIRRLAKQYDAIRIGFDSQGQYECLNISKHSYWPVN